MGTKYNPFTSQQSAGADLWHAETGEVLAECKSAEDAHVCAVLIWLSNGNGTRARYYAGTAYELMVS